MIQILRVVKLYNCLRIVFLITFIQFPTFGKAMNPFHATGLFYIPCKHQKARGFLMISGSIERDQLCEMG